MSLNGGFQKRFHGKSSGVTLVQVAMNLKEEVVGTPVADQTMRALRPRYWKPNPWEWMTNAQPRADSLLFPPEDLQVTLVQVAFTRSMVLFPVIHRPSFEKSWKAGLHKENLNFARVFLMVCAIGARHSNDARVFIGTNDAGDPEWNSAGWAYFSQVMAIKRPMLAPAGLSDLQATVLMSIYLQGTSAPHAAWLVAGIGLRFAQDIGAHREKVYGDDHPYENQMWKRAFWCLVALDRVTSAGLGRPIAIFDEDIDADLPLEVDDEYYDEVKKEWKQPEGKPARISAFNHYVKLQGILAYAIRTVYSINKSKVHLGFVGPEWESHTVAELDSALNSWLDSLPDHLKWDPNCKDNIRFEQQAMLRLTYHYVQITIHRPFIPVLSAGGKASPLSFPSLAICTNAARSNSHILEQYSGRWEDTSPLAYIAAFTAGAVLLISIWGVQKNKLNVDLSSQIADVHRCIKVLHKAEKRWHTAGRLCDILTELATVNNVPLPKPTPTPPDTTRKRDREEDVEEAQAGSSTTPTVYSNVTSPPSSIYSRPSTSHLVPPTTGTSFSSYQQPYTDPSPLINAAQMFASPQSASVNDVASIPWVAAPVETQAPMVEQAWENYHIGGIEIPGMNSSLSRSSVLSLPGPHNLQNNLSPNSFFQEFLGGFAPEAAGVHPQDDVFNLSGNNDWNWMGEIGLFGVTPSAPQGNQQ